MKKNTFVRFYHHDTHYYVIMVCPTANDIP